MTRLTKVLIGVGITAVGAGVAAYYATREEKQEVTDGKGNVVGFKDSEGQITTAEEEDRSFIKKIKRYVHKKFIKALAWVTIHMEQIEAVGAVLGLAGTVISISSAVRDFAKGYEVDRKLNKLQQDMDIVRYYQDHDANAINHNNKVFAAGLGCICDKVGVDPDVLKLTMVNCDPEYYTNDDLANTLEAIVEDYKKKTEVA